MGLFSSKKKITVSTSVQPVFSARDLPDPVAAGFVMARLQETKSMPTVMQELSNCIAVKGSAAWKWAKNNYAYGTPSSALASSSQAESDIVDVLKGLYGNDMAMDYYFLGPLNSVHYAWHTLQNSYSYDAVTNQIGTLSTSKGTPVYLRDLVPQYTEETVNFLTEQDELHLLQVYSPYANAGVTLTNPSGDPTATITPYTTSPTASTNQIKVYYEYLNRGVIKVEYITLTIAAETEDDDYHQARVRKADGTVIYFTYKHGEGTYPAVDNALEYSFTESGTFMPWVYFRYGFDNLATPSKKDTDAYKDSHRYCRALGLDYQTMADGIYADTDLSDVIHSMLIFGVQADADSRSEREYLYRYFDMLHQKLTVEGTASGIYSQVIRDKKFTMSFTFTGLTKTTQTGSVAQPGKYAKPVVSGSTVTYQKQIDATTYAEITVTSPNMRYHVLGKYSHSAGLGKKELLIPLDRAAFKEMGLVWRNDLLARGMHFMMCTYIETKEKWYQSTWFKVFLIVIVVVLTIVTFGGFAPIGAAIMAAVTAGAAALLTTMAIWVIKGLLLRLAVKTFIDVAGLENSVFAAVLLIAASAFVPSNMANSAQITQGLLAAGNNMISQVGTGYGEALKDIQKELAQFSADAQAQWEQLEEKRLKEFGIGNPLSAMDYVMAPAVLFGEAPSDFFLRIVHTPNPGPYIFNMQQDYVDNLIKLPTFRDAVKHLDPHVTNSEFATA